MGKFLAISVAVILANMCLPAKAALWGGYYIENGPSGRCSDDRLSPDDRIADCDEVLRSGVLYLHRSWAGPGALAELDKLAQALEDKADYAGASQVYSKAIALASHQDVPCQLSLRGFAYLFEGKSNLAIADFNAAALEGGNVYSYTGLGQVAAADGRYDDAIALYNKAIALNPDNYVVLSGRANIYAKMGEYDKAMADDKVLVENYHSESFAYNGRCWDRAIANRDLDAALDDCKHALDLLPDDPEIQDSLGFVLFRQQKWDEAIVTYTAALSHNPYLASSLYMRGISELRKGDKIKGQADIDQAEKIYPHISAEYATYGVAP